MRLATEINTDPGCYVEGGWGWKGSLHLIEQFADWDTLDDDETDTLARHEANDYDDSDRMLEDSEWVTELADEVERLLNETLPENRIAGWHDGEFFILAYCGGAHDCADEECGCQDW